MSEKVRFRRSWYTILVDNENIKVVIDIFRDFKIYCAKIDHRPETQIGDPSPAVNRNFGFSFLKQNWIDVQSIIGQQSSSSKLTIETIKNNEL